MGLFSWIDDLSKMSWSPLDWSGTSKSSQPQQSSAQPPQPLTPNGQTPPDDVLRAHAVGETFIWQGQAWTRQS